MKSYKYKGLLHLVVVALMVGLLACEQGPNFKTYEYPAPIVQDFSPKTGYVGEDITITGKDFGDNKAAVNVFFGEVKADSIRSVTDDKIVVKSPVGSGSGAIRVVTYGKQSETATAFTFLASASITSVSLEKGKAGDVVTLLGQNFGTDKSKVKVTFSGVESEIVTLENNRIVFKLPNARSNNLILIVDRQTLRGPRVLIGDE